MIKIGMIGAGGISEDHSKALRRIDGAVTKCAADIVEERASKLAKQYGAASYADYKRMIQQEELDAVIISLPHGLHKEAAVFASEHGLHVLIEKPMANTSSECDEMIEAAQRNQVKLMIGHVQRYIAENIRARELIRSGEFGIPVMVTDIRNIFYFNDARPKWFLNKKMAGGGILMNYGAHSIDKLMWLMDSEVAEITGKTGQYLPGYEVEGNAQLLLELKNGMTGVISYSGYKTPAVNETVIYFTGGVIRLCTGAGIWISKGGSFEEVKPHTMDGPFFLQLKDFISSIANNSEVPVPGEYGRKIIKAIEKVYSQKSIIS